MNDFTIGLVVGLAAVLVIAAIIKLATRNRPMSVAEKAEYLSKRRARMLPALVLIYFSQQASYLSWGANPDFRNVTVVKISAWLVLSALLLAALATKGFWFQPRDVRSMIDDELTRSNRGDAMRVGFIFAMLICIVVYAITMFEVVSGRDAVHIVLSIGLGAALIRWGWLERRAYRDA